MKWVRKNKLSPPSSSPSSSSIITRVFQLSWFSKFKQKVENSKTSSKNKNDLDFSPNSIPGFYSMDEDDPYWRLSFGDQEIVPARRSTGGLMMNPVWSDFDHEFQFPVSGLNKSSVSRNGCRNFNDMVLNVKRMKARAKMSERERDIIQVESKPKGKGKGKVNVKAYSPRTECKIRALEEMKRARMRMKRGKRKEEEEEQMVVEGKTVFDSFAVLRSSFDPQRDFRDSMVEMIRERRIRRSEDLEELLACYLDLNSDEYHDVIVKVFCRIWFDLKGRVE
ncbi:hypothetical protein CASFOL_040810 [Castilleja foliolosa]|uniref:Transcription repressor n=1 Tax=Castilleja foliolosa TaxID=1961234 RepID=A0ABD3BD15_9LAMI